MTLNKMDRNLTNYCEKFNCAPSLDAMSKVPELGAIRECLEAWPPNTNVR